MRRPEYQEPCPSCDDLRRDNDAGQNFLDLKREQAEIKANPKDANNYLDMAEIYLKGAVRNLDKGDYSGARLLLKGTDLGRKTDNGHGAARGWDGALDVLKKAAALGAEPERLKKLNLPALQLKNILD